MTSELKTEGDEIFGPEQKQDGEKRPKQAEVLVNLAADADLFHDADSTGFASFRRNGCFETWRIRSKGFKAWLCWRAWQDAHFVPSANAVNDALNTLEGRALNEGPLRPVFYRVARTEDAVYLDLGNAAWTIIKVDRDGWRQVTDSPVRFVRNGNMRPLPEPSRKGDVKRVFRHLNISDDRGRVFVLAWLVHALAGRGPFPVLNLNGPQGSAKSCACELLRLLLDPSKALVRNLPRSEDDLLIAATHGYVVTLDNVSTLPHWLSDALCRISTGAGLSKRVLYSDGDEHVSEACRPCLVNGIGQIVERSDLADRMLDVVLNKIEDGAFRPKDEILKAFEQDQPHILGGLLDAVVCGLRHVGTTTIAAPRMADFARFVEAASPAIGWTPGYFVQLYTEARREQRADLLENNELGQAVLAQVPFTGKCSDLLHRLEAVLPPNKMRPAWLPKNGQKLSSELDRLLPLLATAGVLVNRERAAKSRVIRLIRATEEKGCEVASHASLRHSQSENQPAGSDAMTQVTRNDASFRTQSLPDYTTDELERMADEAAAKS